MSDSAPPPPPPPQNPYGSAPPPPPPGPAGEEAGTLGARFLARFIDGIIVGIVVGIISAVLTGGSMYSAGRSYADYAISAVIGAVIYLGYWGFMESRGQTLGKMLMKLHVEGPNGGNPTMAEAVKRNLWVGLGILGVLGYFGSLIGSLVELVVVIVIAVQISSNTPTRQTFMDNFAGGTRVVKRG